ncbi:MAG: YiiG family protein [Bacteroidia bacterium]|nr:YiiG family protein [Bacteroidia bacterium]
MEKQKSSTPKNLLFLGAILLFLFLYFKNKYGDSFFSKDTPDPQVVEVDEEKIRQQTADSLLIEKLNAATYCINNQTERVFDSYHRYLSWLDREKGPTGKESHIYGLYSLYDYTSYVQEIKKNETPIAGKEQLDTLITAYIQSLEVLYEKVETANRYYEHEDYKDDDFAKAREMHQPLLNAFDVFAAADKALRSFIENEQSVGIKKEIESAQSRGDSSFVRAGKIMQSAREIMIAGSVVKPLDINLADFTARLDQYIADSEDFQAYAKRHKEEEFMSHAASFLAENDEFLKNAKDLMRRVRDKKPYDSSEQWNDNFFSGWMIEGSPYELQRGYNDLAERYNDYMRLVGYQSPKIPHLTMLKATFFHLKGPV